MVKEPESLTLKWGTLKAWSFKSKEALKLLTEYSELGASMSAMAQQDTDQQKEIICKLIDVGNFETVYLSWAGKYVSKEEAKKYIREYGKDSK